MTDRKKALAALERLLFPLQKKTHEYKIIRDALTEPVDKCLDCGSPMMEVCSGLEKISRESCQPVTDDALRECYTPKYTALCERLRQPVDQGGYDGYYPDKWLCSIADKIEQLEKDLGTNMTMYNAWRKRAEEAEAEIIAHAMKGQSK